ncbi:MAG: hypothetical protein A2X46_01495 [Lentisphaerae bacterium GWF2_57_35]|nr:MAG: hypothetical protein A2X46_01495 [Lentisphaerae bacterium GWF2_57_35]
MVVGLALSSLAMSADEQMQFADGIFSRGMYDMAIPEYLNLLRDFPSYAKNDVALFRLAESYRHTGNKGGADRFYRRVVTEHPASAYRFRSEFRRAELFVSGGQYLEAVSLFRALIAAQPPADIMASAQYYLGYCLDKLRIQEEAEKAFLTVIEKYPESPFASYACLALAEIYHRVGGRESSLRELYEKALEKPASARVGAEAVYQTAELAFRERDYPRSAEFYEQLMSRYPDDYRVQEAALRAAWSYHNAGHFSEGLDLARKHLAQKPQHADEWLYLKANCERQLNQRDEALRTYAELLTQYPQSSSCAMASYEQALLYFQAKRFDEVAARADKLKPAPEVAEDFAWMVAESFMELGKNAQAQTRYEAFLKQFPQSERAASAWYRLAELSRTRGDYARASECYRQVVQDHPANELAPEALFASAWCRSRKDEPAEAIKDWDRLIAGYPGHAREEEAYFQKALTEYKSGRAKESAATFGKLLGIYPDSPYASQVQYWLGVIYEEAGETEKAEKALQASLKLGPSTSEVAIVKYRLAAVLQKRGQMDASAGVLQGLLEEGARADMPPALLEWLARHWLEQKTFDKAIRSAETLAKSSSDADWKQIGWCLAGKGQLEGGNDAEARKAFEEALKQPAKTGEGAEAALYLADIDRRANRLDAAQTYYQQAADMSSAGELLDIRAKSYYGLGQVAGLRREWDQAARYYMSVAVLFDDPTLVPECLFRAAEAFKQLGREKDRLKTLEELKSRYPDSEWSRDESGMEHQVEK